MTEKLQSATLVECSACKAQISEQASSCPHCGHPFKNKLAYWKDMWIPLLSLILGLVSVLSTSLIQVYNGQKEVKLKHFEITLRIKQETYAAFMRSIADAFESARSNPSGGESLKQLNSAQSYYFGLEPFIDDANVRRDLPRQLEEYKNFLLEVMSNPGQELETFNQQRERFRDKLYPILFKE